MVAKRDIGNGVEEVEEEGDDCGIDVVKCWR